MMYPGVARELIEHWEHDLAIRQRLIEESTLFRDYNPAMEAVHLDNVRRLQSIMGQIGWPTREQIGDEASQAAWLIVQYAISLLTFMKSMLALMYEQATMRTIDPVVLVSLSDRIAMYEDRPQLYGTQFVDDEHGRLVVYQLVGSIDEVNQHRRQVGLKTVEERLAELTAQLISGREKQPTGDEQ